MKQSGLITGDNIGEEQLDMSTEADIIHIVPRVMGAGGNSGVLQTCIGCCHDGGWGFSNLGTFGATTATGMALIGAGAGMMLWEVLLLCSCRKPKLLKIKIKTGTGQTLVLVVRLQQPLKVIQYRFSMVDVKSAASF